MSQRQPPWWANLPAPEMTRSEQARWTDLQVLAYLWAVGDNGDVTFDDPVSVREVATALCVSVGRVSHSIRRMLSQGMVGRDEAGWYVRFAGQDALMDSCFILNLAYVVTYPRDEAAA